MSVRRQGGPRRARRVGLKRRILLVAVPLGLAALLAGCGGGSSSTGGGGGNVISVTISPTSVTLGAGQTQQFSAAVTGTSNPAVNWTATVGSISTAGLYTAPNPASGSATVTATSQADAAASSSASVTFSAAGGQCAFPAATGVAVGAGQTASGIDVAVPTLTPSLSITAAGIDNSAGASTIPVSRGSQNNTLLVVGQGLTAAEQSTCLLFGVSGPGDVQVTQPTAADFFMCGPSGGPMNMPCAQVVVGVSAGAALGGRDLLVTNGSQVAVFVGGLMVTK